MYSFTLIPLIGSFLGPLLGPLVGPRLGLHLGPHREPLHGPALAEPVQDPEPGAPPSSPPGTIPVTATEPASEGAPRSVDGRQDASLVVTPTRSAEERSGVPYSVDVVDEEQLTRRAYRTMPEALRDVPGVATQATSHGQGSPYLRGLTGYHTLLLVDGVRVNNSVFRSGPNQYWNTVDSSSIDRLELVLGPSSVLYGSDAIGGTVNAITRAPYIGDRPIGGRLSYRYSEGEDAHVGRLELGGALGARTRWLAGVSLKDFGDVEAGSPTGEQPGTGYEERDADFKLEHWLGDETRLTFAHQTVDQVDVPRTHSTRDAVSFEGTTIGSDRRRDLDQRRDLTYVKLETFGEIESTTTLSYQRQEEKQSRTRSNGTMDEQGFDVGTVGLSSVLSLDSGPGRFTTGFDWSHDRVDSYLERFAAQTPADDIQGPVADDGRYDLFGIFAQQELAIARRTDLTVGARWTYAAAESDQVRDPVTSQRTSLDEDWSQLTGSVRLAHALDDAEQNVVYAGISQGFRAPNFSDLSRFDTARTNEFEVPSTDLDPEHFLQLELGARRTAGRFTAQAAVHYTFVEDVIQRFPTGNVNGSGDSEITKANVGDGDLYGLELGLAYALSDAWTVFGDVTWLDGEIETFETAGSPVVEDHWSKLQPLTAHLGARYEPPGQGFFGEVFLTWADDAGELSLSDEADTSRIPPGGTPGYAVLDLRGGANVAKGWDVVFGVENVTDEDYRVHGSGSNRVGRNLYVGFSWSF